MKYLCIFVAFLCVGCQMIEREMTLQSEGANCPKDHLPESPKGLNGPYPIAT